MSVYNDKVCCNCRHDIRTDDYENYCDIDGHYIGYIECFEGWCRHWAKEKRDENTDHEH